MNPGELPTTYLSARQSFLAACAARHLQVESFVHPRRRGRHDEELAIDVACAGNQDAPSLLVVSSGMHGVEGVIGSAGQVAVLREHWDVVASGNVAVLLVHAVNPHGFSWLRRVNEDNVDLNRNFIDHSASLPVNTAYEELHEALCPPQWTGLARASSAASLGRIARARGIRALQAAVALGQYRHPDGLFYGGVKPAWSNSVLREILQRHAAGRACVLGVDIHTGLGRCGEAELIHSGGSAAVRQPLASLLFGALQVAALEESSATPSHGLFSQAYEDLHDAAARACVTLEIGTVPLETALAALQADNWLHCHGDPRSAAGEAIRRAMLGAFCPADSDWRRSAIRHITLRTRRAILELSRAACAAVDRPGG